MGRPRRQGPKVHLPSPLHQTHFFLRPLSEVPPVAQPNMGLVKDPAFWKRFSTAIHKSEAVDSFELGLQTPVSSIDMKDGNEWLAQQHKEKRRCRILCMSITLPAVMVIIGVAVVGWYFTQGPRRR